ncbi:MAG: hypothetical protein NXH95_01290 [Pseudomonadaceae bacterium]|nr:hypothetical protein [Pseudomonadaceae bacterium]
MSGEVIDEAAIPEGEYTLKYLDYRTVNAWNTPRVVVRFSVIDYGEHFETVVERWYRVSEHTSKPKCKKSGDFKVTRKSDLFREYTTLFGSPGRNDRISFVRLKNKRVVAQVRTVTEGVDRNGKPYKLDESAQYSVVGRLLRIDS